MPARLDAYAACKRLRRFSIAGEIGVVMDDLPPPGFTAIDVRDAVFDSDLLSGKRHLPLLDAHFVGHIPSDLDALVAQFTMPP